LEKLKSKYKNAEKSISSRLDDKIKFNFRIHIAVLYQLVPMFAVWRRTRLKSFVSRVF